ncbi:MAG: winged helix-turn-helix domain-containing protein [Candidatus Aenigmatarchaeota archaeon]
MFYLIKQKEDKEKLKRRYLEESLYNRELTLIEIIRNTISAVGNNPSKSLVFLATEMTPLTVGEILINVYQLLGCTARTEKDCRYTLKEEGILGIFPRTASSYFDGAIIELSHFAEKKREKRKTRLGEREFDLYYKTLDGAVIGNWSAFFSISLSSDSNLDFSTYKIFSVANTPGETSAQEDTILLLLYLYKRGVYNFKPIHEIIDDLGFKGKRRSREYAVFCQRFTVTNIQRLKEAGLVEYESRSLKEEIKYYPKVNIDSLNLLNENNINKLREKYSDSSISIFKSYATKILKIIIDNPGITNREIAEKTGINVGYVTAITPMLRYLDLVDYEGKTREEFGLIKLTSLGKYFVERYLLLFLKRFGVDLNSDITYHLLNQRFRPNLEKIFDDVYNLEKLLYHNPHKYSEFKERCKIARIRHQEESGYIKKVLKKLNK